MKIFGNLFPRLANIFLFVVVFLIYTLLPQINSGNYIMSTITSKFIVFIYSCLFLTVLYALYTLTSRSIFVSISKIDIILFVIVTFITFNRYYIQSQFGFSIPYIELLGLILIYVILRSFSFDAFFWLLIAIILSSIFQCYYGYLQILGYSASNHANFIITGDFFNPGPYAGFLASVWSAALGIYLFRKNFMEGISKNRKYISQVLTKYSLKYVPLIGIVSILLMSSFLGSRASWLAIVVSGFMLIEFKWSIFKRIFKKINFQWKIIYILISGLVIGMLLIGLYLYRPESSKGRIFIWKITSKMIAENPIFGIGYDRFKAHYMNYQADYFSKNGETSESLYADNVYYSFNEWLQFIAEGGLTGGILLFILLITIFQIKVNNNLRHFYFIVISGLFSIGIFAFFSYPTQILPIKIILIAFLAMLSKLDINKFNLIQSQSKFLKVRAIIFFLSILVFFNGTLYIQSLDKAFKNWKTGLNSFQHGNPVEAVKYFEMAYPFLKRDGEFLSIYGKSLYLINKDAKALNIILDARKQLNTTVIEITLGDIYKSLKCYDLAETTYKRSIYMVPTRFYSLYSLAKLYDEMDNCKKAITTARILLQKSVKVPSIAIEEMKVEMKELLKYREIEMNKQQFKKSNL